MPVAITSEWPILEDVDFAAASDLFSMATWDQLNVMVDFIIDVMVDIMVIHGLISLI